MKKVIAVSSAKGGVGKSTIAGSSFLQIMSILMFVLSNMSPSKSSPSLQSCRPPKWNLRRRHFRSFDSNSAESIWRASIVIQCAWPEIFILYSSTNQSTSDNQLIPLTNYGVQSMSMGYLVDEKSPVVWRGLMVMKALQQLLHEVEWDGLDVLVLDLPPGTGDTQLTITQQIKLDG